MSFRYLKYGHFPTQFDADFSGRTIAGYSILNCNSNTDSDGSGGDLTDSLDFSTGGTTIQNRWNLIYISMDNIRATIGASPIILNAGLSVYTYTSDAVIFKTQAYRMLSSAIDWTSCTWRYADTSPSTTWTHDIRGPAEGDDFRSTAFWEETVTYTGGSVYAIDMVIDLTSELAYVLRANDDLKFLLRLEPKNPAATGILYCEWRNVAYLPHIEIRYLNPIEIYHANNDGTINLQAPAIESEDLDDSIDLGAIERGQTGSAVKAFAKNLSDVNYPLLEIWDDCPEATVPTHTAGSGTGNLDFVVLTEAAVSQKYTVNFYSATEYEVQAEGYRDYPTSLHPTIDADSNWRGTTGTDFSAPSGGLTIPSKCWHPDGLTTADDFTVYVLGNTTDTSWPADSNQQVEITSDNAGVALASGWRPVQGRRTKLRVAATVDATTKKFYVLPIVATDWVIGTRCWVGDSTNVDEGDIKTVSESSIGSATQTGSGLDDINLAGNYIGTDEDNLYIEIDGTGSPDTFKWGRGSSYPPTWDATTVNCVAGSGNAVHLEDNIKVYWDASTGHTSGDYWTIALTPYYIEVENLTSGSNAYAIEDRVCTTLPIQDTDPSIWALTNADSGVSEAQPQRIYIDDPTALGFTAGSSVTITSSDGTSAEDRVIDTGGVTSTYIELTVDLTEDYTTGAFVVQAGDGDAPFWLRATATSSTTEELKQLRLSART